MSITKNMIITDSLGQEVDRRDIGAEAQNIDVSRDADGKIITDITASGVEVSSVESLTQTLKNIENNSQIALTFDEVPTTGSDNPVKSKGLVPDTALSPTSTKPVQNKVITEALSTKLSTYANNSDAWDEEPTINSIKPVTSRGIKNVLDNFYVTTGQKSESTLGSNSTIEGVDNVAEGTACHAEGYDTTANGMYSHTEGRGTQTIGMEAHAEGFQTCAVGSGSHAEGSGSKAGSQSHAEGYNTIAEGASSHAEGYQTSAMYGGESSSNKEGTHAEGYKTYAYGQGAHAEGNNTTANYYAAHAEGYQTYAGGNSYNHAEGVTTTAIGEGAHAEGCQTCAHGNYSHSGGYNTTAKYYQTVIGQYNIIKGEPYSYTANSGYFIVGSGSSSAKANCFRVTESSTYGMTYNTSGADYAEMFEWLDGNQNNEDRVGKFVTLDGDKIKLATSNNDYILGIVSGNASVIGDVYDDQWRGMFETDIYGRPIYEKQERELDDGTKVYDDILKVNPNYDSTKEYIPRSERPEWSAVGLLGKLICLDDGTAEVNNYITVNNDSIATKASSKTKYRVMKRINENHIQIMIL